MTYFKGTVTQIVYVHVDFNTGQVQVYSNIIHSTMQLCRTLDDQGLDGLNLPLWSYYILEVRTPFGSFL